MNQAHYDALRNDAKERRNQMEELSDWIEGHALSRPNAVLDQPDLDAELLGRVHQDLVEDLKTVEEDAREKGRILAEELRAGEVSTLDRRKDQFCELNRRFSELENRRDRVYRFWQERILEDGMIARLGSRKRFYWLEQTVIVLTVVVLLVIGWEMLGDPSRRVMWALFAVDTVCCSVFWVEYLLRRASAEDKKWFFRRNWVDIASAIPVPMAALLQGLPLLPLQVMHLGRVLRFLRLLRVLPLARRIALIWRGMERLGRVADVTLMTKSLTWLAIIWLVGAAVLHFEAQGVGPGSDGIPLETAAQVSSTPAAPGTMREGGEGTTGANRGYGPNIDLDDWGDRLWWSATTVVTGGYADLHDPRLPASRLFTAGLVLSGLIVVGVFTATLTSVYVGEESQQMRRAQDRLHETLKKLTKTLPEKEGPLG